MRSLSSVRKDDHVQVRWKNKFWYDCDVIATDDDDSPTCIMIRWRGWAQKYSQWVGDPTEVRKPRAAADLALETAKKLHTKIHNHEIVDGEVLFMPEKVVGQRTRDRKLEYHVKWLGYENHPQEYTWEPPDNIPNEYIDAFDAEQLAKQRRKQPPKRKREAPAAVPFSVQAVAGVAQAVRDQRRDDAEDLEETAARAMTKRLRTQAAPGKQAQQLFSAECSAERFVALWERARQHAAREVPSGVLDEQVSQIKAVKGGSGGANVEDRFTILNPSVLHPIVEPFNVGPRASGDIYFRDASVAMQLVGPFTFSWTTARGVARPRRLLRVFGFLSKASFISAATTTIELPTFTDKDTDKGRAWKEQHLIAQICSRGGAAAHRRGRAAAACSDVAEFANGWPAVRRINVLRFKCL